MRHARLFLRWIRLEDSSGKLSLTTIAFVIAMFCLLSGRPISMPELAAFAVAVTAHRQRQAVEAAK